MRFVYPADTVFRAHILLVCVGVRDSGPPHLCPEPQPGLLPLAVT